MSEQVIQIVEKKSNGMATAGFVLALITVLFGWIPFVGWVTWLLGLIFSALGLSKANKVGVGKGLAIAGLVISLIGIVVLLVVAASIAAIIGMNV
ncbi:hypothetical protein [Labilibaculum manganireducens]|uniref:hypothetical protein n=1 Tax=Labilibaculum manganireducens TaxID=1940525 RepID=UPI0029F4EFAE|nr:hypothetical protein [Labilibaculum manganireducens]